jgi:L-ascorbate metabolism protein UlaG (beta-lactamase superfamily)
MKHSPQSLAALALPILTLGAVLVLRAAPAPDPLTTTRMPDGTARLQANDLAQNAFFRIESTADLRTWTTMATLKSSAAGSVQLDDTAAPHRDGRFYRLVTIPVGETPLTGDHLATAAGDVVIHPVNHASFVMQWNGLTLYSDPVGGASAYAGLPPADIIVVTHSHGDHYSSSTIAAIKGANARIFAPQAVYNSLSTTLKASTTALANGADADHSGVNVAAIAAYNLTSSYHVMGTGNSYILTLGGKRIFISGDTEDVPEIRALENIDAAFLCMNLPFTMTVLKAASTLRDMRPAIVYPYHFRNSDNSFADLDALATAVGTDLPIEIRRRVWY